MPGFISVQLMTKRKPARRRPPARHAARLAGLALTLAAGVSLHSCAELPGGRELAAAGARLQALFISLGMAVRQQAGQARLPGTAPAPTPGPSSKWGSKVGRALSHRTE